jgi:O-antigen ligase
MTATVAALPRYVRWALWLTLALLFALPCVIGRNTTYVILLAGLAAILTPSVLASRRLESRNPVGLVFTGVFVALAVAFAVTAENLQDVVYALNFSPFLLAVPLRWQLERVARPNGAVLVGWLSLAGTIGAAGLAVVQIVIFQQGRVGQPWMNIFHYADTTMLLGFLTLVGWFAPGTHQRWPFLLGPVIGIAAVIASGTRGALLAAPVLVLVAFVFALLTAKRKGPILLAAAGGVVVLAALLGLAIVLGFGRGFEAFTLSGSFMTGGKLDNPSMERLQMMMGGWRAFLASPLFGYGWDDMVEAIYPYVDPAYVKTMHQFRHLHNGVISFAASGGIVGLLSFIAISVMPIVAVFYTARDSQFLSRLYLALTLCAGYAVFQLTFLLIGFDFPTVQYAYMTVVIVAFVRDPMAAQSAVGKASVGSSTMKAV